MGMCINQVTGGSNRISLRWTPRISWATSESSRSTTTWSIRGGREEVCGEREGEREGGWGDGGRRGKMIKRREESEDVRDQRG